MPSDSRIPRAPTDLDRLGPLSTQGISVIDLTRDKLLILPLHCGNAGQGLLNFQKMYLYGLVAKLNLFSDILCKNLFLKEENNGFESRLTPEQRIQGLNQYARNNRCRYILTGSFLPRLDMQQQIKSIRLSLRLYDANENRLLFDVVNSLTHLEPPHNSLHDFSLPPDTLNNLWNWATNLLLTVMMPERSVSLLPYLAKHQLTRNLESLKFLILAEDQGEFDARIKTYENAVRLDPTLEIAYSHLGRYCRLSGLFEKSIAYYQKAFEVSQCPEQARAFYSTEIGIGYAMLGQYDEATHWWLRAIELAPRFINPYMNVAITYEEQGDLPQAETFYMKAQAMEPNDQRTYYSLGGIYQKQGKWKEAIQQYQSYLAKDDKDPWCHNQVATCYLQLGDQKSAASHLEKSSKLDPAGEYGQFAQLILSNLSHV